MACKSVEEAIVLPTLLLVYVRVLELTNRTSPAFVQAPCTVPIGQLRCFPILSIGSVGTFQDVYIGISTIKKKIRLCTAMPVMPLLIENQSISPQFMLPPIVYDTRTSHS